MLRGIPVAFGGHVGLMIIMLTAAVSSIAAPPVIPGTNLPACLSQSSVSPSGKFMASPGVLLSSLGSTTPLTAAEAESTLKQALNVRQTGSNTFRIGSVEFDTRFRTVILPARLAVRTQAIEYALVNEKGKAYESLFTTEAGPSEVHVAFLLLGVSQVPVGGDFNKPATVPLTNALSIEVAWEENGRPRTNALCDLIRLVEEPRFPPDHANESPARPMPARQWLYNGSVFDVSGFAARREGSIIAVIRDSAALVNNPGKDRDNDHIHYPNTKLLPPEGSPVRILLRVLDRAVSAAGPRPP
jgi:hypothetical protein